MFLWNRPVSLSLKQHLKQKMLLFSEKRTYEMWKITEEVTGLGSSSGEMGAYMSADFVMDVMYPEIVIKILEGEGLSRLQSEVLMTRGGIAF
ncbi:hypothetical protein PFLUV_G00150990 [Perca fluviatilis]|uniref:Uncharacterized protein n=1 Tax=Perca fluviatilis TaxID=8168 RepID=A0A6A5E002_PERFL|nr:hypothetical protein PFLUV_G00150990 [Perca fluviatilis]